MVRSITEEFDTIAAISTPAGEGAIHIVRMTGDQALPIIDRIYKQGDKKLSQVPSHTIHYGHIIQPDTAQVIDEVMVTIMRAPKTYTKEDVVEINCHGGVIVANRILNLLLNEGARLAEAGEFTKRAFLNGRIDLSQAEAVIDIIQGKTDQSVSMAVQQLEGRLATKIKTVRQQLFDTLGEVEVNIDYPEYDDVEEVTMQLLQQRVTSVIELLEPLLKDAKEGKILREGLNTAIIGRPNVGKSSLLNELLHEDKAIVTNIAGTTRDVLEEFVNVNGVPLKLIDTAGIRDTDDTVEKIGVQKSKQALQQADFVLLLLNQSEPLTEEDKALLAATDHMKRLILLNKKDLPQQLDLEAVQALLHDDEQMVSISAKQGEGIAAIGDALASEFFQGKVEMNRMPVVSNTRHIHLIEKAIASLKESLQAAEAQIPVDLVQMDVREAWETLGEIIGESAQDEMLDQLFSQFCLGK